MSANQVATAATGGHASKAMPREGVWGAGLVGVGTLPRGRGQSPKEPCLVFTGIWTLPWSCRGYTRLQWSLAPAPIYLSGRHPLLQISLPPPRTFYLFIYFLHLLYVHFDDYWRTFFCRSVSLMWNWCFINVYRQKSNPAKSMYTQWRNCVRRWVKEMEDNRIVSCVFVWICFLKHASVQNFDFLRFTKVLKRCKTVCYKPVIFYGQLFCQKIHIL